MSLDISCVDAGSREAMSSSSLSVPVAAPAVAMQKPQAGEVRRVTPRPRDPMKALAQFVAESLVEKLGDGGAETLLKGLFSERSARRKRGITICRLIDMYMSHAETYYRHADGTPTSEVDNTRYSLVLLRKLYGRSRVEDFGPLKLKALREAMVKTDCCRKTINNGRISCVKRIFKWGVENEVIPADRYHALQAVSGLKMGRSAARESEPVKPVPAALVEAVLPHVSVQVATMIRLQLLTGMRPGEVISMRTGDIDRSAEIWIYRPVQHKTAHHMHSRYIFLGPQAQELVRPYLKPEQPHEYLFSAADAEMEYRRQKHAARKTPLDQGNAPGSKCKRRPKNRPGKCYRRDSYTKAIRMGCSKAFPVPEGLDPEAAKRWQKEHHWHPHQLRHNAATRLRSEFGIDAAQTILGHKTLAVTAIYAERDMKAAVAIMKKIG